MLPVHLVCHLLASTRAVSARRTVSLGGGEGEESRRMVDSLVTVLVKTVLQALGDKEEGESCEWLVRIL